MREEKKEEGGFGGPPLQVSKSSSELSKFQLLQENYSIARQKKKDIPCFRTGLYPVDFPDPEQAGGTIHILLGPPGCGKSSVALMLALAFLKQRRGRGACFYFSWDFSLPYFFRLFERAGGDPSAPGMENFLFSSSPDNGIDALPSLIEPLPPGSLIIIDYLQVVPPSPENLGVGGGYVNGGEALIRGIADKIIALARRLPFLFLVISSMNRSALKAGGSSLYSGWGTARIEYGSDSVVVASREEGFLPHGTPVISLDCKKNRWGPEGKEDFPLHPSSFSSPGPEDDEPFMEEKELPSKQEVVAAQEDDDDDDDDDPFIVVEMNQDDILPD